MRIIHDGEERHSQQRAHWEQYLPRRLFTEDAAIAGSSSAPAVAGGNRGSRPAASTVRWEAEAVRSTSAGLAAEQVTPPPLDRSPMHRRSKSTEDGTALGATPLGASSVADQQDSRTPPPLHRSASPVPPRRSTATDATAATYTTATTSSTNAGISYQQDSERERDFSRHRTITASVSNAADLADAADSRTMTAATNVGSSSNFGTGRRVAVPALPERLNALQHLSLTTPSTSGKSMHSSGDFSAAMGGVRAGGPGEYLMDRLLRAFAQQQDGGYLNQSLTSANAAGAGGRDDGGSALAVDALEVVAGLLTTSKFPRELQEEAYGLFARLSRSIPPSSRVALPVSLLTLRPTELTGCAKPVPVTAPALVVAKRNLAALKLRAQESAAGSGVSTPRGGALAGPAGGVSSLFYDPFAARRHKERVQAQHNDVLWAVGQRSTLVAVLSNPLCVPVFLTAVFPVLRGAECTVYPVAVHIPPNAERFEVELSVTPTSIGQLEVVGLQFIVNNATHVLQVDKTGRYVKAPK
jgi:hypothetical protein